MSVKRSHCVDHNTILYPSIAQHVDGYTTFLQKGGSSAKGQSCEKILPVQTNTKLKWLITNEALSFCKSEFNKITCF